MSCLLPQELIDQVRHQTDVAVRMYGIDCTIFIPTNLNEIDENTVYTTYEEYTYIAYAAKVFVEWSPNQQRLRQLGLHMEKELPIIAWFENKFYIEGASDPEIDVDIIQGSYFVLGIQFIPDRMDTEEFEIVDLIIKGMLDKVTLKAYKIAPRRVK